MYMFYSYRLLVDNPSGFDLTLEKQEQSMCFNKWVYTLFLIDKKKNIRVKTYTDVCYKSFIGENVYFTFNGVKKVIIIRLIIGLKYLHQYLG